MSHTGQFANGHHPLAAQVKFGQARREFNPPAPNRQTPVLSGAILRAAPEDFNCAATVADRDAFGKTRQRPQPFLNELAILLPI
jgi:hypothetical protein